MSPVSPELAGGFFTTEPHGNPISTPHFFLVFISLLVVAVSQTCLVDDLGNFEGGWLVLTYSECFCIVIC